MMFKKKRLFLNAYATGTCIPISEVQDEVFSQKMMGDGFAIFPSIPEVVSPCDGIVSAVFETTQHAVGLTMSNGMELLLHVGLDTVNLKPGALQAHVCIGQKIIMGDCLITYDKAQLTSLGYSDVTMCVILKEGSAQHIELLHVNQTQAGITPILQYTN